jgi:hypothetical protein
MVGVVIVDMSVRDADMEEVIADGVMEAVAADGVTDAVCRRGAAGYARRNNAGGKCGSTYDCNVIRWRMSRKSGGLGCKWAFL